MDKFFARHLRKIFAVIMAMVVVTMLFYGVGTSSNMPRAQEVLDVKYKVGVKGKEHSLSKRKLEAMIAYLSYDFGYGINDALERQNIFSDGFFYSFIDSHFGDQLIEKFFPLVKEEFAEKIEKNRKKQMYSHPSGKLVLENEMKIYAEDLHKLYKQVKDKNRLVDSSLLRDCIALFSKHRYFQPKDFKLLSRVFIRDRRLESDPTWERRNFALFGARSNVDIFGKAFVEAVAQSVIAAAIYANENGYHTTFEEAEGVITRRALDVIGAKYYQVVEKKELLAIKDRFQQSLGLSKDDLTEAARSILTIQKMLKDCDTLVLVDDVTAKKLYKSQIEQILVQMVQDSAKRTITSAKDALELQLYLSAIGPSKTFLAVPEEEYSEQELLSRNPDLLVKSYLVKMAKVSKKQVGNTIALKKVWDYELSDEGFAKLAKKFSFEKLPAKERFAYLQSLGKQKGRELENYTRALLVDSSPKIIEDILARQELKQTSLVYNEAHSSLHLQNGMDMSKLVLELDQLEEGAVVENYSQDGENYFRIVLLQKPTKFEFPTFNDAKKNGYLAAVLEKKLLELNNGKELDDQQREKYVHFLLKHQAGEEQAKEIIAKEAEEKHYIDHKLARIKDHREGKLEAAKSKLLEQFNIYKGQEVVSRNNDMKEIAKEEFFALERGQESPIFYLENGEPYYICLLQKKDDKEKLLQVKKAIHRNLCIEARDVLFKEMFLSINQNEWFDMSRFKPKEER